VGATSVPARKFLQSHFTSIPGDPKRCTKGVAVKKFWKDFQLSFQLIDFEHNLSAWKAMCTFWKRSAPGALEGNAVRNSTVGLEFEMSKPREMRLANLYWLAFLITADQEKGVRAVTSALENSGGPQGLASNRTRELLVEASIAEVEFDLRKSAFQTFWKQGLPGADPLPVRLWLATPAPKELRQALLNVDAFPRCALLLTAFEHMTCREPPGCFTLARNSSGSARG
jgi:hypothetical protein